LTYRAAVSRKLGSSVRSLGSAEAVDFLMGSAGVGSGSAVKRETANLALGSAMAADAASVFPHLRSAVATLLDRSQHDALSPSQLKIFQTPAGPSREWLVHC
jgi:hypothetical protein